MSIDSAFIVVFVDDVKGKLQDILTVCAGLPHLKQGTCQCFQQFGSRDQVSFGTETQFVPDWGGSLIQAGPETVRDAAEKVGYRSLPMLP